MPRLTHTLLSMLLLYAAASSGMAAPQSSAFTRSTSETMVNSIDLTPRVELPLARLTQHVIVDPDRADFLDLADVLWVSSDGSRALVVMTDERLDVWCALLSIWPECAALVCGLAGVALIVRARRIRRIPLGAPHCARCGYLLYGEPARCSECGTLLSPDTIAFGRHAMPVLIAGVFLLSLAIPGYSIGRSWLPRDSDLLHEHGTWYSRSLYRAAEHVFPEWAENRREFCEAVFEYHVSDRTLGREVVRARWDIEDWNCAPPKRDSIVLVSDEDQLVVISAIETTRSKAISLGDMEGWPMPIGWTSDGNRVFFYDISRDAVGVADLHTSKVDWLFEIPSHLTGCFGPWGPFFDMHPTRHLLLVDDPPAKGRGEPIVRIRDLDRNAWVATINVDDGYGLIQFSSDGRAVIGIDWNPHGSGIWGETDEAVFTYWPLDDVKAAHHVVFSDHFEYDERLAFDSREADSWRLVGAKKQDGGDYLVTARDYRASPRGETESTDTSCMLPWPTELEPDEWWSSGLTLRDHSRIEWRLCRGDSQGSALFVYDLGWPPLPR